MYHHWPHNSLRIQACHITSLASSPVRHQFAVGLNTGKVKYFTGIPSETAVYYETMVNIRIRYHACMYMH